MEPLDKAIPKKDLATGIGTAVVIHVLIFGSALFWALLIPHKPLQTPYYSVDLVSAKDIGAGRAEPKGQSGGGVKAVEKRARHATRAARKIGPVVPIRRLAVNDAKANFTPPRIKEIAPKDVPATPEKTQGVESIDNNLSKLVARPKTKPHFRPPVSRRSEQETSTEGGSSGRGSNRRQEEAAGAGSNGAAPGSPNGTARGGRQGAGAGSAFGSPDGSSALGQVLGLYGQRVREKIESQWRLSSDRGVGGLMAVLEVRIRRSGEVVQVVVMRRSGNELFDQAAVRAVNMAAPLPPVPEAVAQGNTPQFILTFRPGKVS